VPSADFEEARMYREWKAVRRPVKPLLLIAAAILVINCDSGSFLSPTEPDETPVPMALRLELATSAVVEDDSVRMKVVLVDGAGRSIPGATFEWSSSDAGILSIQAVANDEGLLLAHEMGTATITVSHETLTESMVVQVHNRPVDVVHVSGSGQAAASGSLLQDSLVVAVIDRRGDPVSDVIIEFLVASGGGSVSPTWTATDVRGRAGAAWTIGMSGEQRVTAHVSAAQDRIKNVKDSVVVFTASVIRDVVSLQVSPDTATLEEGDTVQLVASAATASGEKVGDPEVAWESNDTSVATITPGGVLTARKRGSARATATMTSTTGTVSASATVNVVAEAVALVGLRVRPSTAQLATGATLQFEAVGIMSDGSDEPVSVSWSATGGSIDGRGLFTAGATAGSFQVVAVHAEGLAATADVSVVAPTAAVAGVIISPATDTINSLGATTTLDGRAVDSSGAEVADVTIEWSSQHGDVASVDAGGTVTAKAVGTALIVAAAAGFSDTASVVVQQVPAAVQLSSASLTLAVGESEQLTATVTDAGGSVIPNAVLSWSSSAPAIAAVTDAGLVSGVSEGTASIAAASGSTTDSAPVSVAATAATPPPPAPLALWISKAELDALPMSGPAWTGTGELKQTADAAWTPQPIEQQSSHMFNVQAMAGALVFARLYPGSEAEPYRQKVVQAIRDVMAFGDDVSSSATAPNRNLGAWAISADLVNLPAYDPVLDAAFREWLMRKLDLEYRSTPKTIRAQIARPNNQGSWASFSLAAASVYLGDVGTLDLIAVRMRRFFGDTSIPYEFRWYGDQSWQMNPTVVSTRVGINPKGAARNGHNFDGIQPEDQARNEPNAYDPADFPNVYTTRYNEVSLEGLFGAVLILHRAGYTDLLRASDRALLRAAAWVRYSADQFPEKGYRYFTDALEASRPLVNFFYDVDFPEDRTRNQINGRAFGYGWTYWTHAGRRLAN
jgi:uncharacterized protein YjdB